MSKPFDFSSDFYNTIIDLRSKGEISNHHRMNVDPNEYLYLLTEKAVRDDQYKNWQSIAPQFTNDVIKDLANAYLLLFTNPFEALGKSKYILENYILSPDLELRVKYWIMDCYYLTGDLESGNNLRSKLPNPQEQSILWRAEAFAIYALDMYFINDNDQALFYHLECQKFLEKNEDTFLSIFNSSMALRIALKLCEPFYFDYFSQVLNKNISINHEKRYSLRIYSYRALILQQLGHLERANEEWEKADLLSHQVQMDWEKGQYYLFRGFAEVLKRSFSKSQFFLHRAKSSLESAGSPRPYLAELELALNLKNWLHQDELSKGILSIGEEINAAKMNLINALNKEELVTVKHLLIEGIEYCENLLKGNPTSRSYSSLVLSLLQNRQRLSSFGQELVGFKLYGNIVYELLKTSDYSIDNIQKIIEKIMGVKLIRQMDQLTLSEVLTDMSLSDFKQVLSFANGLIQLHSRVKEMGELKATVTISKRLVHDLRSPIAALNNLVMEDKTSHEILSFSLKRLCDITNDLAQKSPPKGYTENLDDLLVKIIQEKRIEYKRHLGIFIHGSFCFRLGVDEAILTRIISNLINNSYEADANKVDIFIEKGISSLELKFLDDGIGFSQKIFKEGVTTKMNGSGIGLSMAQEELARVGGNLEVKDAKSGAEVCLFIPLETLPKAMVHLEDDKYLRLSWTEKAQKLGIKISSFQNPRELESQLNDFDNQTSFYLDYYLEDETSEALIEKLYASGFKNIYLTTGDDELLTSPPRGVKRVQAKDFPFKEGAL